MIPFDTFTLAAAASELRAALLGAKVQKIQQPSQNEIVLSLYGRTGAHLLLLSADPQRFRVHLTQLKRENPVTPPHFCQICRKHLEGARLDEIILPRFDRILHLVFHAHDGERLTLVAELMGRNANLVLVGGTGIVRGAIRPTPPDAPRPLRPNSPYAEPPGSGERHDPLAMNEAEMRALAGDAPADRSWLLSAFSGIGPFAADEIIARAEAFGDVPAALAALMAEVRAEDFAPHAIVDAAGNTEGVWAFAPLHVPANRRFPRESVSVALDTFHSTLAQRGAEETERTTLTRTLERETAFRRRELAAAERTRAEEARAEEHEQTGNLLLAGLSQVERGAETVTLPDLYGDTPGAEKTLALDPRLSPQENAEAYFERARKAREAGRRAADRIEELSEELAALADIAADLESAEDADDYAGVRRALTDLAGEKRVEDRAQKARPARDREKPFGGHRVRTYGVDGYNLLVGETAEANDYLTTRVAAPADLWLHVRAGTGAHGVLRTSGKPQTVPEDVLRRAAEIVAARSGSSVKHAGIVAVDVVERRYVRKPRGAKPGLVTYTRERTLDVSPAL